MKWKLALVGFVTLMLSCSSTTEEPTGQAPFPVTGTSQVPERDGGDIGPCDRVVTTTVNGQKLVVPALCDPNYRYVGDPPDKFRSPIMFEREPTK